MARKISINGIELKGINTFRGMEGYGVEGSIYLDNKNIGTFVDDASGGPLNIIMKSEYQKEFNKRIKEYFISHRPIATIELHKAGLNNFNKNNLPINMDENSFFYSDESFINELIKLNDYYDNYKKCLKKGYNTYMEIEYYHLQGVPCPLSKGYYIYANNEKELENEINKLMKDEPIYAYYKVFKDLNDFIITKEDCTKIMEDKIENNIER